MNKSKTVTCTVVLDIDLYEAYKEAISERGDNVEEDLVRHMIDVAGRRVPNRETLEALEEVKRMEADPSLGKGYTDVDEMMRELLA